MKRSMVLALVAGLVVPGAAMGTSTGTCLEDGVRITFTGFTNPGLHDVRWDVRRDGVVLASGVTRGHGSWSIAVAVSPGPVVITDYYVGGQASTVAEAGCRKPVEPPVRPVPPGASQVPPPPVVPANPPVRPPVRPVRDCRWAVRVGAGPNTLRRLGCVRPRPVRVCPEGFRRSTVRIGGTVYTRCTPRPELPPAVTGYVSSWFERAR